MNTNTSPTIHVDIRWLVRRDMPEILAIESASFDFPWSEDDFRAELIRRNCIGMVCEHETEIVGYMIYDLNLGCLNMLNLTVHPEYRRCGIGRQMMARMVDKLNQQRRNRITVTVWERNLVAQKFFRATGFRVIDTVAAEYGSDTADDAYVFQFHLKEDDKS